MTNPSAPGVALAGIPEILPEGVDAYTSFEEKIKGPLEPDKLADMVVLDRDYFTAPAEQIKEIKPIMTIVGGEVAYRW